MMRSVLLAALVASSSALSAAPAGLRPSVSSFRPAIRKDSLELRGGAVDDFKLSPTTALKTTAATMAFFAAACCPNLLPPIGIDGTVHEDQCSLYYSVTDKQTLEVDKTMRWCTFGYTWIAGLNWAASECKDEGFKKDACKVVLAMQALALALLIKNNQPWTCGAQPAIAVLSAINVAALL